MSKSDKLYKIFMTSMIVIIAGLLLATGIIAIQKSMKMNLSFEANPNYLFEVYIQKSGDDTKKLVFRNYEKSASEGVVMENGFSTLYGNTLSADDTFLETYGSDFEFIIENHTKNSGMRVSVTANVETEGGHEGILPTITEDKMTATKLKDGSTADYIRFSVTTTEVVFPQTTVLNIVFSEYNEYAVGVSPSSGNFTYTANPVAISGENYTANIKAKTGYSLEITVTRDDGTTTPLIAGQGKDYVWDSSTGALTIYASAVTGDITINCLNDNAIPYAISYTLNGGDVAPANPTAYTVEDTFTLTNPTKPGYNFDGWTGTGLNSATTTVTIAKGSTGDRSYTATWTAKSYTITYSLTKCTSSNTAGSMQFDGSYSTTLTASTGYSLPSSITVSGVSSGGYSWTQSTGALTIDGSKITGNITITVSAGINSYTATFNGNGGSNGASIRTSYGSALGTLPTSTRTGYNFNGWYTATSGGTKITESTTMPLNGATYYAQWTAITYYVYATINGTTAKTGATYTISSSSQTKTLSYSSINSSFISLGGAISTTKGSVSGTTLTIPANTTGDITIVPKGYTIGTYVDTDSTIFTEGTNTVEYEAFAGYKYLQFNHTNSNTYSKRWIIIGGDSANSTSTYGTGANKEYDTFSAKQVLLLSEKLIETQYYDNNVYTSFTNYHANKRGLYYQSDVRYLCRTYTKEEGSNDNLDMSAYTSRMAQKTIQTSWNYTSIQYNETYNDNNNVNTTDYMFLLAYNYPGTGYERYAKQEFSITDYLGDDGDARRICYNSSNSASYWWLRSGYYSSYYYAYYVRNVGDVYRSYVYSYSYGVRPSFILNLA